MKPIVIVGCGAKKVDAPSAARDLYTGALFRAALSYAGSITEEIDIAILSAKYGLLDLNAAVVPYNVTWDSPEAIKASQIAAQMPRFWCGRHFVLLCGAAYRLKFGAAYRARFEPETADEEMCYEAPLQHLGIGQQLKWLKENTP